MGLLRRISGKAERAVDTIQEMRAAWTATTPVADEDDVIKYWRSVPLRKAAILDEKHVGVDLRLEVYPGTASMDNLEIAFAGITGGIFALVVDFGCVIGRDIARKAITFYDKRKLRYWAETYDAVASISAFNYLENAVKYGWPVIIGGHLSKQEHEIYEFLFQYIHLEGFNKSVEEYILSTERRPRNGKLIEKPKK